jgi:hypothetical protein
MIFGSTPDNVLVAFVAYLVLAVLRWRQYGQAHRDGLLLHM